MNYPEIRFRDPFLLVGAIYNDIESAYKPPITKTDERYKLSREFINKKLDEYEKPGVHMSKNLSKVCAACSIWSLSKILLIYMPLHFIHHSRSLCL